MDGPPRELLHPLITGIAALGYLRVSDMWQRRESGG
jgi:hypothetical protein